MSHIHKKIKNKSGNCYTTCEALYHLLGGKKAGYKPMFMYHENAPHWFLGYKSDNFGGIQTYGILDPTAKQFKTKPNYLKAVGKGFLTGKPSKRAKILMKKLLWKDEHV